jgi:hypothetical protein
MFGSLNDEIRKQEAVEPLTSRLLRYGAIVTVSIISFCALYAGLLLLE